MSLVFFREKESTFPDWWEKETGGSGAFSGAGTIIEDGEKFVRVRAVMEIFNKYGPPNFVNCEFCIKKDNFQIDGWMK